MLYGDAINCLTCVFDAQLRDFGCCFNTWVTNLILHITKDFFSEEVNLALLHLS